jgi:HSP20 family protein
MTIMHFDPFRDLDRLTQELFGANRALRAIPMEAYRRGDTFYIHFDLPGVNPGEVEVTAERNVVSVRASRESPRQEGDELVVDERPHGSFSRQIILGENLDAERMQASYDQGVLTLMIPVAEQAKPRRVEVAGQAGSPQPVSATAGSSGSGSPGGSTSAESG